jgi:predicted regulator of Ras-like GTPase activity (Roadblock/LC7/MglB family)
VSDDIRVLSARLAAEPDSLAFLPLGEALRRRGQLEAALTVATAGVQRYPALADAHDLVARIRADRSEGDLAFDAWTEALRHDPAHVGALRGLAFLAFRSGDAVRAERHLLAAVTIQPGDASLRAALARVQGMRTEAPLPPAPPPPDSGVQGSDTLLVDGQGRRLAGLLLGSDGADHSDAVAAALGGVAREAGRAVRLLGLGAWRAVTAETAGGTMHLVAPSEETLLLAVAEPGVPPGRLALIADRAAAAARRWLEKLG